MDCNQQDNSVTTIMIVIKYGIWVDEWKEVSRCMYSNDWREDRPTSQLFADSRLLS